MRLDISGESDFKSFIQKYKALGADIGKVADDAVAKVASEGRKEATSEERRIFKFDSASYSLPLGGYTARNGVRLMSFSFENSANRRKGAGKYAHVVFTSRMANLFENDTKPYSKASPLFKHNGSWTRIRAGEKRYGKRFFYTKVFSAVQRSVPAGLAKADMKLSELIASRGLS